MKSKRSSKKISSKKSSSAAEQRWDDAAEMLGVESAAESVIVAVETHEPSRHSGTPFLTGSLGLALADANDSVEATLRAAGFEPYRGDAAISREPFTSDPKHRAYIAGFAPGAQRQREVIMPGPDFVSSFPSRAQERVPMSDETKALLRARGAEKRFLRPKPPAGAYLLQQLCDETGIKNPAACAALRKSKTPKPDHGRWAWATKEEAVALFVKIGALAEVGGKVVVAQKQPKQPKQKKSNAPPLPKGNSVVVAALPPARRSQKKAAAPVSKKKKSSKKSASSKRKGKR